MGGPTLERVRHSISRPLWTLIAGSFILLVGFAHLSAIPFVRPDLVLLAIITGILHLVAGILIMSHEIRKRWIGLGCFLAADLILGIVSLKQFHQAQEVLKQSEISAAHARQLLSRYGKSK